MWHNKRGPNYEHLFPFFWKKEMGQSKSCTPERLIWLLCLSVPFFVFKINYNNKNVLPPLSSLEVSFRFWVFFVNPDSRMCGKIVSRYLTPLQCSVSSPLIPKVPFTPFHLYTPFDYLLFPIKLFQTKTSATTVEITREVPTSPLPPMEVCRFKNIFPPFRTGPRR